MHRPQLVPFLQHLRTWLGTTSDAGTPDGQLLQRFVLRQEEAAFATLLHRHGPMVFGVCRRLLQNPQDAEDAFQATFLVLVRKAAAIRKHGSVASWLHGVAARIAARANADAGRRRIHETGAPEPLRTDPQAEPIWRDVRAVLDAEILALPEKYRLPFVLCCVEERSRAEVARLLGWREGTVGSRLARARERLRQRLTQRGVTLSAGMLSAVLAENALTAAVPNSLGATTARLAALVAIGEAALTAGVSAPVAALAKGAMQGMAATKLKAAVALLALLPVVVLGAAVAAQQVWLEEKPASDSEPSPQAVATPEPVKEIQPRLDRHGDPLPPGAVARLGSLRLYHGNPHGEVDRVCLAPDGSRVVSSDRKESRLWETATGKELPLEAGLKHAKFYAAGGKLVAVDASEELLRLVDSTTGREVQRFPMGLRVSALGLSSDGRTLVWGAKSQLHFADVPTGQVSEPVEVEHKGFVYRIQLARDGRVLAVQWSDNTMEVWDVPTRTKRLTVPANGAEILGHMALAPDGALFAAASLVGKEIQRVPGGLITAPEADRSVRLWDTSTGKELPPLVVQPKQRFPPGALAFSPDGKHLAGTCEEPGIRLWDVAARKVVRRFPGTGAYHLAFSSDGKVLAGAVPGPSAVALWDVGTGRPLHDFGHTDAIYNLDFTPDGKTIISGGSYTDNVIRVWDPLTGRAKDQWRGHSMGISALAVAPDGSLAVTSSQDKTLRFWDVATGREVRQVALEDGLPHCLAFSPDGKTLAGNGQNKAVHFWDVATGQEVRAFEFPAGRIGRVTFSPDGKTLATYSFGEKVARLWEAATGRELRQFEGHTGPVCCLAFSSDGNVLATGSEDGTVRFWEPPTGRQLRVSAELVNGDPKNRVEIRILAFSPDGRSLAVGYSDRTVRLWELATGQERVCLEGHREAVLRVKFSLDGSLLASGSGDRTIVVWDMSGRLTAAARRVAPSWDDLASGDAHTAFRAMQALQVGGDPVVSFLKQRLQPVPAADAKRLARLILELDSEQFSVREKAARELGRIGESARPALQGALAGQPSEEVRRRVTALLEQLDPPQSPARLRELRAVEVLEHLATVAARQLLADLAKGAPDARLTQEAKASVQRLAKPPP